MESSNPVSMNNDLYHDINNAQVMPSEDWTYTMRRTMQEIVPGVFLGKTDVMPRKQLGFA